MSQAGQGRSQYLKTVFRNLLIQIKMQKMSKGANLKLERNSIRILNKCGIIYRKKWAPPHHKPPFAFYRKKALRGIFFSQQPGMNKWTPA